MDEIYNQRFWMLFDELDVSLEPPGPDELYEVAAPLMAAGTRVLDVGCRDARHLIELARRFDIIGFGVDPVAWHVERAEAAVREAGLEEQIAIRLGRAEVLMEPTATIGTVWCRDVLEVLPDLPRALAQMRRVLKSDGH